MDAQLDVRLKDAQVAVVGAMLIDDRCIGDVLAAVSPDDFPAGPYKSAFVCIRRLFADGRPVDPVEFDAYLDLIASIRQEIQGVHLYGLARPSLQPDAKRLSALSAESLFSFAERIAAHDIEVVTSP